MDSEILRPALPLLAAATVLMAACGSTASEPPAPRPSPAPPPAVDSISEEERRRAEEARREAREDSIRAAEEAARDSARRGEARREAERREAARREEERKAAAARDAASRERRLEEMKRRRDSIMAATENLLPGSILPRERVVAFYGHANSTRMGILGELPPEQMLDRLDEIVEEWEEADPATPVQPALHLITTMAAGTPGPDSLYRIRLSDATIDRIIGLAEEHGAIVFLDIQPGRSTVREELPRLGRWLERPDVHLALDPEWAMGPKGLPGKAIGTMDAEDVNFAIRWLDHLVQERNLPPKILVVHRFTQHMLTNVTDIVEKSTVQLVVNMDGWGPPAQKLNTYRSIVAPEIPEYAGFKLFFKNDVRGGSRMLTPQEILDLNPVPFYIQYQ